MKPSDKNKRLTPALYQISTLEEAFDALNKYFFDGQLPRVMISMQRKKGNGYFSPARWQTKDDGIDPVHEISLSPSFLEHGSEEIMATLLHLMVHLWLYMLGKAPSHNYHNKECARKMISFGLKPVSVENERKTTGQKMKHEIVIDGAFDKFMKESSIRIRYYSPPVKVTRKKSNVKYTCQCNSHVSGKSGLNYTCNDCGSRLKEEDEKNDLLGSDLKY